MSDTQIIFLEFFIYKKMMCVRGPLVLVTIDKI